MRPFLLITSSFLILVSSFAAAGDAIQLHKGNPNRVEIKDLRLKVLPETQLVPFEPAKRPASAKKIEKPRTSRPQGTGPVVPVKK